MFIMHWVLLFGHNSFFFLFQHGTIHYKGMIPPFWNPFKLLDLNHILRTIDDMAQKVCLYEWSPNLNSEPEYIC